MTFPKIELHVHLEGTVRAGTLLQIAGRNGVPLPADTVKGLAAGLRGALCDQQTKDALQQTGAAFGWPGAGGYAR